MHNAKRDTRSMAFDSSSKLDNGSDLFRSLNTLRVENNAPNPFVVAKTGNPPTTSTVPAGSSSERK